MGTFLIIQFYYYYDLIHLFLFLILLSHSSRFSLIEAVIWTFWILVTYSISNFLPGCGKKDSGLWNSTIFNEWHSSRKYWQNIFWIYEFIYVYFTFDMFSRIDCQASATKLLALDTIIFWKLINIFSNGNFTHHLAHWK